MNSKIKKALLVSVILTFLLALTGCDEKEELNFSFNEQYMQDYTKEIIEKYCETTEEQQDYYLSDGTDLEKTAVAGFMAADTTDHVGEFMSYKTGEGSVKFSNGADGKVLCSQICKYEHRNVKVTVAYKENKKFYIDKQKAYDELVKIAAQYNTDVVTYITQAYAGYPELDMTSVDKFLESYLIAANGEYPFEAVECEVSPVYSKGELIGMAGKNTAIGMGVVFLVLIFISFIISLLKFLPMLFDADIRKAKAEEKASAEKAKKQTEERIIASGDSKQKSVKEEKKAEVPAPAPVSSDEDLMNDSELVAVITAAIYAAAGGGVRPPAYTASNDKLVVRSIRRVK